jgi:hypothetical protein
MWTETEALLVLQMFEVAPLLNFRKIFRCCMGKCKYFFRKPYKPVMTCVILKVMKCYHEIVTDAKDKTTNANVATPEHTLAKKYSAPTAQPI